MPDVFLRIADFSPQPPPIAIAPDIHPMPAPALTVLRTFEQPRDDLVMRLERLIGRERFEFFGGRRQANQVERHPPQPDALVGFRLRRDAALTMLAGDESVDRIALS